VFYSFTSTTSDPEGDDIAFQFEWGDGTRSNWSNFVQNDSSIIMVKSWITAGTYSVRVRAKDVKEKTSEWSGERQITIYANNPPNVPPIPNGDSTGNAGDILYFSTSTTDPNNDSISYQFEWGNSVTSNWSSFIPNGATMYFTNIWSIGGTYNVKTRAKDIKGAFSDWSLGHQVTIFSGNAPPNAPSAPTGPSSSYTNTVEVFSASTTDPNGDPISYQFDWGDGTISNWTDFVPSGVEISLYHEWSLVGSYLVKVRAKDTCAAISNWSNALNVTISYNAPPTIDSIAGPGLSPYYTSPNSLLRFTTIARDSTDSVYVKFMHKKKSAANYTMRNWLGPKASGSTFIDSITFSVSDTYLIRAIAKDTKGSQSDTSQPIFEVIVSGPLWRFATVTPPYETTDYDFTSSPALGQDPSGNWRLFIGAHDGCVYSINIDNGHGVWRGQSVSAQNNEEIYYNATPTVNQTLGHIYIGSEEGELYCFTTTGTRKWHFPDSTYGGLTYNEFGSSATFTGNRIYVGCDDYFLYALQDNDTRADTVWTFYTGSSIASSPAIDNQGNIYFGDNSGYVTSLSPSRQIRWRRYLGIRVGSSPSLTTDRVYVGTNDGYLYALELNTGNQIWRFTAGGGVRSTPVIGTDGCIYFGCNNGYLYALTAAGTLKPNFPIQLSDDAITSTPAIANDGTVIVYVSEDVVYGVSLYGTILWHVLLPGYGKEKILKHKRFDTFYPSPIIGPDGTIYAASAYAGVYAVTRIANNPLANTAWPKFRHDIHNTGRVDGTR